MTSAILSGEGRRQIQDSAAQVILDAALPGGTPRSVEDAVRDLLADRFGDVLGDLAPGYSIHAARRAMADLAFEDREGRFYTAAVRTRHVDAARSSPDLVSVESLARYFEDDANHFVVLLVDYATTDGAVVPENVRLLPIEWIAWDCLAIGALGLGRIQIADARRVVEHRKTRRTWMLELCDALFDVVPREIERMHDRLARLERVHAAWKAKADEKPI